MPLATGTRIGPYEITAPLGAGGMGEVYRARDARLGRDVAIKTLPPLFVNDPERLARFEREARTLAALSHPHIAQIYGLETGHDGPTALVMELVDGESLAERLSRGPLPLDESLAVTRQIADALEAAHEKGIIHRDLKPANVMVTADGDVKVLDFGLARAAEPGVTSDPGLSPTITSPATQMGVILGTAAYMSPEQAKGRVADKRSDVWALGCVMYEMLTGRRAFEGEDMSDTLAAVLRAEPDWAALPAATPPHVTSAIQRCLTKDRRLRIPDASVVRFLIDQSLSRSGTGAAAIAAPAATHASRARRAAPLAAAALAGAAVVAAIGWPLLRRDDPPRQPSRFKIETPGVMALTMNSPVRPIAISPDGRFVVYTTITSNGTVLMLRPIDRLEGTAVLGTTSGVAPFFSPDSKWLGFVSSTAEIKKVPVGGGPVTTVGRAGSLPRGAAWGPDGTIVFATSLGAQGLMRVPATGGTPETFVRLDVAGGNAALRYPSFLPGGRGLLYNAIAAAGPGGAPQVMVLDLETQQRKALLTGWQPQYVDSGHIVFAGGGALRAVAFDLERLEVTGDPFTIFEGLSMVVSGAAAYDVSANGTLVYTPGGTTEFGQARSLAWVDRTGREEPVGAPPRAYFSLRIAPDGTRVVSDLRDQETDIWVWDIARRALSRLTFEAGPDLFPVWTPDSRAIVFRSAREGVQNLFRRPADGTGAIEALSKAVQIHSPTDVTPDGTHVVFTEFGESQDVMMTPLEAKGGARPVTPLVRTRFQERNGTVSPDGRWLAYESDQSSEPQIYVRPFPATDTGLWQVSPGRGSKPVWSRNGRELFYVDSENALVSVAVGAGPVFQPGEIKRLFTVEPPANLMNGTFYDVMPDGRRFMMIKEIPRPAAAASDAPHLVVVLDWLAELQGKR